MTDDHASAAASCWRDSSAQPTECWRTKVACFCAMRHPEYRALVLVLVAKHWRNLDSRATGITSYHLELLCMEAVRQCGSNVRGQFRCLLERFASGDTAVNNPNRFNRKVLESGRQSRCRLGRLCRRDTRSLSQAPPSWQPDGMPSLWRAPFPQRQWGRGPLGVWKLCEVPRPRKCPEDGWKQADAAVLDANDHEWIPRPWVQRIPGISVHALRQDLRKT